jgi:opacity protein-like surface antigen
MLSAPGDMHMKRFLAFAAFLALAATLLSAADISGDWKGAFDYNGNNVPLTFHLKSSGNSIEGSIEGLPTTPAKIMDGKLQEQTVTFWVNIEFQGQPLKLVYKGKVAGDQIEFNMGTEDGSWGTQLTAKKST